MCVLLLKNVMYKSVKEKKSEGEKRIMFIVVYYCYIVVMEREKRGNVISLSYLFQVSLPRCSCQYST